MYTRTVCAYCVKAKRLLDQKGIPYTEINLEGKDDELIALKKQTGWRTVPQIFIGDEFIGGCDELYDLEREKKLDSMLS